jgi:transcriptional regulator with XRE-family HTH domain
MSTKENIGKNLRLIRAHKNVTMDELAHGIGMSKSTISQIESGQKKPSLSTLEKLSTFLKVPIECFFKDLVLSVRGTGDEL